MPGPVEPRTYRREEIASFRKTDEKFGGLSNMAPGFPVRVNDVFVGTAEALYQACRFPHLPDVQHVIISQTSPMTAKMKSKPHRSQSRPDWDDVRIQIMRWCLRVKLVQNWESFASLLLATGNHFIVEDSRRDDFWGAVSQEPGTLMGQNVLGRLLMELRQKVREAPAPWETINPPNIPSFLLYGQPIGRVDAVDAPSPHMFRRQVSYPASAR